MSDVLRNWKLSVVQEQFSLPEALVFYIAKNPSSVELFHKLIRCCKYFWLKNPIITFSELKLTRGYGLGYWHAEEVNGFHNEMEKEMKSLKEKLWIYQALSVVNSQNKFLASTITPKIYRCDLTHLRLSSQNITFTDFKMLASSGAVNILHLFETIVKKNDGAVVPIEELIELLPKLRSFDYYNARPEDGLQTITSETAAKLVALPHFPKIKNFDIKQISELFDIDAFFATPKVSNFSFV